MIDLKNILYDRDPRLLKRLKGFPMSFLEWFLRIGDINALIDKFKEDSGVDFARKILSFFQIDVQTIGMDHLREDERYIFASNHPSAGIDGLAFITAMNEFTQNFKVMVNEVLYYVENLRPIFMPVNPYHRQKHAYVRALERVYRSDQQVLILPGGACSRMAGKTLMDFQWKNHFIKKSIAHKRSVVPVHISDQNPSYFYFISKFRRFLGIKTNLEELWMSRAFLGHKPGTITVTFKEPVPYTRFNRTRPLSDWVQYIKDKVYE